MKDEETKKTDDKKEIEEQKNLPTLIVSHVNERPKEINGTNGINETETETEKEDDSIKTEYTEYSEQESTGMMRGDSQNFGQSNESQKYFFFFLDCNLIQKIKEIKFKKKPNSSLDLIDQSTETEEFKSRSFSLSSEDFLKVFFFFN